MACLIGSGYATGQEILQFFAAYGKWGLVGMGVSLLGLLVVTRWVAEDAKHFQMETASQILPFYCGSRLGRILTWGMPVILFSTLVVMISGAGTAMAEYYGWHPLVGRFLLLAPIYLTVTMGLDTLVDIIGRLGPITIVFTVVICVYSIVYTPMSQMMDLTGEEMSWHMWWSEWQRALEQMKEMSLPRASGSWPMAALLYTSFNLTMSLAFFAGMGANAATEREARLGSTWGAAAYGVAAIFMSTALTLHGAAIQHVEIPMLYLADRMHPFCGYLFSLILISEIYTTAVPAVWALAREFCPGGEDLPEHSARYSRVVAVLLVMGLLGSLLPFEALVGNIYPAIGYAGILLLAGMIRNRVGKRPKTGWDSSTFHD